MKKRIVTITKHRSKRILLFNLMRIYFVRVIEALAMDRRHTIVQTLTSMFRVIAGVSKLHHLC